MKMQDHKNTEEIIIVGFNSALEIFIFGNVLYKFTFYLLT